MGRPTICKKCGTAFARGTMPTCPNCGAPLQKQRRKPKNLPFEPEVAPTEQHVTEWHTNNIAYPAKISFTPCARGFPRGLYTTVFDKGTRIQKLYCGNPTCQRFITTNMFSKGSTNLHCPHCQADNLFAFQG